MYLYLIDQFLWNKLNAVVNRVLKRSHVLEFDKHAFTLQVKAADRPEVAAIFLPKSILNVDFLMGPGRTKKRV